MKTITLAFLDDDGGLTVDSELDAGVAEDLTADLGAGVSVGCAKPYEVIVPPQAETLNGPTMRVSGYWHGDRKVGPGLRSVLRMQGCPIRCAGCWVPETHDMNAGVEVEIGYVAQTLLDPDYQRDGICILGGEPFAQPQALALLMAHLVMSGTTDLVLYTGFTLEALQRRQDDFTNAALAMASMLIDGHYREDRQHSASCGCDDETRRFSGSCNQRVHHLKGAN